MPCMLKFGKRFGHMSNVSAMGLGRMTALESAQVRRAVLGRLLGVAH